MEHWKTLNQNELELHMSPSRWNPHKTSDQVIQQHISVCTTETQKAKQSIPNTCDISYGSSPTQKYDLYGTDLSGEAPIFIWIHGGYWQEGNKDMSAEMAHIFYNIGVKTLVLGYTLAPQANVTQIQEEIYTAIKHSMGTFKEARFIVGGHSAGGHLAASLLHAEHLDDQLLNRLVGLILFSGVFDLRPLVATYVNEPLKLTSKTAEELSPLLQPFTSQKFSKQLQILVLVGDMDPPEFHKQSREYSAKLEERFQNVKLTFTKGDDHFTIVENLSNINTFSGTETINFMKQIISKNK